MKTPTSPHIARALRTLRGGGVLAYPTEGVWGLGCDPWNEQAVRRLLALKGRSESKGLILIAGAVEQVSSLLRALSPVRLRTVLDTWPGPVTWVVPATPGLPGWLTGGKPGLAVRVSAHTGVAALCAAFGGPIVSTSANPSGRPAALTELAARRYFRQHLDGVLPGPLGTQMGPSEIRDALSGRVLRLATPPASPRPPPDEVPDQ